MKCLGGTVCLLFRSHWSSTRRRNHVGCSNPKRYPGRFGRSRSSRCNCPVKMVRVVRLRCSSMRSLIRTAIHARETIGYAHRTHLPNHRNHVRKREKAEFSIGKRPTFAALHCSNKPDYVPKPPHLSELDLVFDTSYTDIQPYLFKVGVRRSTQSATNSRS